MSLLQGSVILVAGSIETQPKRPESPLHGELPVIATYCSSLLTSTDRCITKPNICQQYFTVHCLNEWKANAVHTVLHALVRHGQKLCCVAQQLISA